MSSFSPHTQTTLTATEGGAALRPLLVGDEADLLASTVACCAFAGRVCSIDALRSRRTVFAGDAFAVLNGRLYTLHASSVARVNSFVDPTKDQPVAPGTPSARLLALSPLHAFFVDGRKLQRAPLASY
jgi:hypothetical protein